MTSVNPTEVNCKFKELAEVYREAEKIIKRAENEVVLRFGKESPGVGGLFIPAVNQLRYAGNHIVSFLENSDKIEERLEKAIAHCVRASCDAYDCVIQFYLQQCRHFLEEYSAVVLSDDIPDFNAKKVELKRISRAPRERADLTDDYFNGMRQDCELVVSIYDCFDAARDEINKKIAVQREEYDRRLAEQRELERKDKRNFRLALFSSFGGGAVCTAVLLALGKWLWQKLF